MSMKEKSLYVIADHPTPKITEGGIVHIEQQRL